LAERAIGGDRVCRLGATPGARLWGLQAFCNQVSDEIGPRGAAGRAEAAPSAGVMGTSAWLMGRLCRIETVEPLRAWCAQAARRSNSAARFPISLKYPR
jgi:hypothetical protein